MGLTAAVGTALAAVCAVAAGRGVTIRGWMMPTALYAMCLVPGIALAATRPFRPVLTVKNKLKAAAVGGAVSLVAVLFLDNADPVIGPEAVSSLFALSIIPLSLLWTNPTVMRFCLLLIAFGALWTDVSLDAPWPVLGALAGAALALVALNRLAAASIPSDGQRYGAGHRRLTTEAAALFAVAALVGILAASLFHPRGQEGGGARTGRRPASPQSGSSVSVDDSLDVGEGRPERGRRVLLRVDAPEPEVWRAQALSDWDGRTWRRPAQDGEMPTYVVRGSAIVQTPLGAAVNPQRFRQKVTIEADVATVLVAAPEPFQLRIPEGGVSVTSLSSTMRPVPPLGKGSRYVVTSYLSRATEEDLRARDSTASTPLVDPHALLVDLLHAQRPQIGDQVRALAADVTAAAPTRYDKARALERWLQDHVPLTSKASAIPPGEDVVSAVVFGGRPRTPAQVATAMAVMLRSQGIPTRLAKGFLPGERSVLGGDFVVRGRDAHSWVEVWFAGAGWQRFDPSGRIAHAEKEDSFLARLRRMIARVWKVLAAVALLVLGWLGYRLFDRRRRRLALPWATRFYARLMRAGKKRGRPRRPDETPAEYSEALADSVLPDARLKEVGELITAAAYSPRQPDSDAVAWAEQVLREAEAAKTSREAKAGKTSREAEAGKPQGKRRG